MNEINLYNLFEQITAKSKTIKRFVVAPGYGNELNKNNLGEILTDVIGGITDGVKFPLCIMFPPIEMIDDYEKGYSRFKCRVFFLTDQNKIVTGNSTFNKKNNLSKITKIDNWNDMRTSAVDFRKVFQLVTQRNLQAGIRDAQTFDVIDRVSDVGNDKLAGVGLSFDVDVFMNCEVSDYSQEDINLITV